MKRAILLIMVPLFSCAAEPVAETPVPAPVAVWSAQEIAQLKTWLAHASADALPVQPVPALDQTDAAQLDAAATGAALALARQHLLGATPRTGWAIDDASDQAIDLPARLSAALAAHDLDAFFRALSPRHPDYAVLKAAYATEPNALRRARIALNMERWRWMPLDLGPRHVLVNVPAFEATLSETGKPARIWPVVVGKLSTPTPVLSAQISGVIYNPWWEVPESIVRESVGGLMRRAPAAAAARGYVFDQGRYRQKPGPSNALGQMKLAMPNPQAIYLHDTPSKRHFALPVRAFSHGCIRVGNALDFAATLLEGVTTRAKADAIVKSAKTQMVPLTAPIPVYIAYFTASVDAGGKIRFSNDIYGKDALKSVALATPQKNCGV